MFMHDQINNRNQQLIPSLQGCFHKVHVCNSEAKVTNSELFVLQWFGYLTAQTSE